jgi:mRNA interferase MazF
MSLPEPFRGEVWDVDFQDFGEHPAVVLSINALNGRLGHVAVIPVTGTYGPEQTHIPLTRDPGLTRYESYADITALQPVARSQLLQRRGLLTRAEIERLGTQLTTYLGL